MSGGTAPSPTREPTLVVTTLAEYQTEFWARVCEALTLRGTDVVVWAFDDRSVAMLKARGIPVVRMAGAKPDADDETAFQERLSASGVDNPNLLFSHERVTFRIRDGARLRRTFLRYTNAVDAALDLLELHAKRPVLLQELGGFIAVIASYLGARRRGIDNWFIEPAFFRGRLFFLKNSFAALDIAEPIGKPAAPEVAAYLSDTVSRRAIVIPRKDRHQYASAFPKVLNKRNARRLVEKLYDKHVLNKHQSFGHIGAHVRTHLAMIANSFRTRALYRPLAQAGRFIYFPLHVPADVALTLRAPEYLDQLALVDYLLRIVPPTHRIAIKEHPAQIGALPAARLRALARRYDNLVILPPETNNFAVLERSDAVVSVNSKSGAEALLLRRPVIVLGDAFYASCPFVTRVRALCELPAALAQALEKAPPASEEVESYFQAVYEQSLPGELYVTDPDNITLFTRSVLAALNGCGGPR